MNLKKAKRIRRSFRKLGVDVTEREYDEHVFSERELTQRAINRHTHIRLEVMADGTSVPDVRFIPPRRLTLRRDCGRAMYRAMKAQAA